MVKSPMSIVALEQADGPFRTPCLHGIDIKPSLKLEPYLEKIRVMKACFLHVFIQNDSR